MSRWFTSNTLGLALVLHVYKLITFWVTVWLILITKCFLNLLKHQKHQLQLLPDTRSPQIGQSPGRYWNVRGGWLVTTVWMWSTSARFTPLSLATVLSCSICTRCGLWLVESLGVAMVTTDGFTSGLSADDGSSSDCAISAAVAASSSLMMPPGIMMNVWPSYA